ncbi:hypothetical protein [Clostridium senegalense]|nr:hypothetical protein [Clostridium senegalense]
MRKIYTKEKEDIEVLYDYDYDTFNKVPTSEYPKYEEILQWSLEKNNN